MEAAEIERTQADEIQNTQGAPELEDAPAPLEIVPVQSKKTTPRKARKVLATKVKKKADNN